MPARFIALAKAEEKLGNNKKAIEALENAFELDPKVTTLRQILAIYEATGDAEAATITAARIEEQIMKDNAAKKRRATKTAPKTVNKRVVRRSTAGSKPRAKTNATISKTKPTTKITKPHVGRKRI